MLNSVIEFCFVQTFNIICNSLISNFSLWGELNNLTPSFFYSYILRSGSFSILDPIGSCVFIQTLGIKLVKNRLKGSLKRGNLIEGVPSSHSLQLKHRLPLQGPWLPGARVPALFNCCMDVFWWCFVGCSSSVSSQVSSSPWWIK